MSPEERAFEAAVKLLVKLLSTRPKFKGGRTSPFSGGVPSAVSDGENLDRLIRTFHLDRKGVEEEAYRRRRNG